MIAVAANYRQQVTHKALYITWSANIYRRTTADVECEEDWETVSPALTWEVWSNPAAVQMSLVKWII